VRETGVGNLGTDEAESSRPLLAFEALLEHVVGYVGRAQVDEIAGRLLAGGRAREEEREGQAEFLESKSHGNPRGVETFAGRTTGSQIVTPRCSCS
jgi:hypothetical protein